MTTIDKITDDLTASILAAGAAKGAAITKPKAGPKGSFASTAMAQALAGKLPTAMVVPPSNKHVAGHADKLRALAKAGDVDALQAHTIAGSNSYARMLRAYKAALLAYVEPMAAQVAAAPADDQSNALPAAEFAAAPKSKALPPISRGVVAAKPKAKAPKVAK